MSASDLGARLGIAPQSILTLEKSELNGRTQMDSLKKAAEALDCTFDETRRSRSGIQPISLFRIIEGVRGFAIDLANRIAVN
jgi:transcriptional regulator with XRE-family HTH domain